MKRKTPRSCARDYAMIAYRHVPSKVALYREHVARIVGEELTITGPIWNLLPACTAAYDEPRACSVQGDRIACMTTQVAITVPGSMTALPECRRYSGPGGQGSL